MSLIEDALRRVQEQASGKKNAETDVPAPPAAEAGQQGASAHSWPTTPSPFAQPPAQQLNVVALAILAVTAGLLIGGVLWLGRTIARRPAAASGQEAQPAQTAVGTPAPSAQKPARSDKAFGSNEFVLSGVVLGLGDPYAVINGKIAGVGERIGGATLLAIASDSVTLRLANGKEQIVKVPR